MAHLSPLNVLELAERDATFQLHQRKKEIDEAVAKGDRRGADWAKHYYANEYMELAALRVDLRRARASSPGHTTTFTWFADSLFD